MSWCHLSWFFANSLRKRHIHLHLHLPLHLHMHMHIHMTNIHKVSSADEPAAVFRCVSYSNHIMHGPNIIICNKLTIVKRLDNFGSSRTTLGTYWSTSRFTLTIQIHNDACVIIKNRKQKTFEKHVNSFENDNLRTLNTWHHCALRIVNIERR